MLRTSAYYIFILVCFFFFFHSFVRSLKVVLVASKSSNSINSDGVWSPVYIFTFFCVIVLLSFWLELTINYRVFNVYCFVWTNCIAFVCVYMFLLIGVLDSYDQNRNLLYLIVVWLGKRFFLDFGFVDWDRRCLFSWLKFDIKTIPRTDFIHFGWIYFV